MNFQHRKKMSVLNCVITKTHSDELLANTKKTSALNYVITKDHIDELLAQAKKTSLCVELCQHTERINLMTHVNTKNGSV